MEAEQPAPPVSAGAAKAVPADQQVPSAQRKKERKPYTISHKREAWTPNEHLRFCEALERCVWIASSVAVEGLTLLVLPCPLLRCAGEQIPA
jgi:hypothetical protein